MAGRTIPVEDWRDVQVVFELGAPVRVVSRLSGISERAIRDRARREDWGRPPFAASGAQRRLGGIDRHGAMRRLWAALETQLADLDGAEEAKIASLARTLEKLVGVERGPTPRSANIGSISGDTNTTASAIEHDFGRWANLAGRCFIRIWNTDKDPWQPAWLKDGNDADELQVTDAGDISGWSSGETLRIGDPDPSEHADGNDLEMFAIDISPYLEMHFGVAFPAKALIMHAGVGGDSGFGRWQASTDGASGSGIGAVSTDSGNIAYTHILVPTTVPSPISNSHLVFMREQDDMGIVLARLMGVYL